APPRPGVRHGSPVGRPGRRLGRAGHDRSRQVDAGSIPPLDRGVPSQVACVRAAAMDEVSVEIPAAVTDRLANKVRAGRLALLVGAGIAEAAGLAGWAEVLARLAADVPAAAQAGPARP